MRTLCTALLALLALSAPLRAAPSNLQQARPIIKAKAAQYGATSIGTIKLLGAVPGSAGVFMYHAVRKFNLNTGKGGGAASGQVNLVKKTATFHTIFPFPEN